MNHLERQKHLLSTGEFSDFTILVEGRPFKVHRSVICPQSPVLHRLCTCDFKERLEGSGSLTEESADTFERVLEFLYTGDYDSKPSEIETESDAHTDVSGNPISPDAIQQSKELMIHANVYLLAKYLGIDELVCKSTHKFSILVSENFRAGAFLEPFARVFEHGDDGGYGLRAEIVSLCAENFRYIHRDGELSRLLREHEPVAWHLLFSKFKEAKKEIDTLQANMAEKCRTIEDLKRREEGWVKNWDATVKLLKENDKCRHCRIGFGAYIEQHRVLRCRSCHCRHFP